MFGGGNLFTATQGGSSFTSLNGPQSPEARFAAQAQGKKVRQEEKLSCLPVTVRTMEATIAAAAGDASEIRFFGEEQGLLVLVAFVESVVMQAASMELSVSDATGRVKARHYMSAEKTAELEGIRPGSYVTMVGSVRISPEPHFAAQSVHAVKSADEVSYHMIEAAHAALKLQRGSGQDLTTPVKQRVAAASAGDSMAVDTPPKNVLGQAAAAPAPMGKVLDGEALKQALLAHLRQTAEGTVQGLNFANFCDRAAPTDAAAVRAALAALVDDGELYNTTDEHHWQVL